MNMIKTAINKLHEDNTSENEINNIYILMRKINIVNIINSIILIIIFLNNFNYSEFKYVTFLFPIFYIINFVMTYNNKYDQFSIRTFIITYIIQMIFLTVLFGNTIGYNISILLTIFICYYNGKTDKNFKTLFSGLIMIFDCILWGLTFNKNYLTLSFNDSTLLSCVQFIITTISFVIIARMYHYKFVKTEESMYEYMRKLEETNIKDPLTELKNRRGIEEYIENLVSKEEDFSIVMGDIDHFKNVNDSFGHDAGDMILKEMANIFKNNISEKDGQICRWGGEEFLLVIKNGNCDLVADFIEKIRMNIARQNYDFYNKEINVTMSFGIASYCSGDDYKEIIKKADEYLYYSKEHGRNRITFNRRK